MTTPPIIHQRHTDPAAALSRARGALVEARGSIPGAAELLGCSAGWLRRWSKDDPGVTAGIALRPRGWEKGRRRTAEGTARG